MDLITNYFESLVYDHIKHQLRDTPAAHDEDYIADVACVALNKLPARYVRHIVDTRFFESEEEHRLNDTSVKHAVTYAIGFLEKRAGISPDGSAHFRSDKGPYGIP
ncbi:late competence development ComFB family protein [Pseudohongiella sp.]|uniref:Late competence development protein ComFB n=1 Tax=marine sediment metagenome TaxID=412755 RepID=A0A0F9V581_9ZZZZ|nr:late competence development ComFB family protein [Pseudohongiella sp.]HDZ08882.1 competence protein ComFB [Pseudohongiella sp.]HEA64040.1 competence protein ComFB [Pseudohongiella sp.]